MTSPFTTLRDQAVLLRVVPRPLGVSISLFFLTGLADGVLMPFFALWAQREAGVPTEYVGLLLGCYAGGEQLATPFVGGIADRLGRRPVLIVSTAGIGAGFLLLHAIHGTVPAALVLLLIGIFESVLHPTAASVIADVAPASDLRRNYALTRTASGAGRVVGPALGAILAGGSLGLVFVGSGVSMLVGTLLIGALLPETAALGHEAGEEEDAAALITIFRDARLALLLLPVAVLGLASSWIEAVLPLYAVDAGTLTPSGIGLLFAWAGGVAVLLQLPTAAWSARMSGFSVAVSSGALLVTAFTILLLSPAVPALIVAVTLVTLAGMLSGPLAQAIVAELAPRAARATYMAAFSAAQDLQDAAGPALSTALFAAAATLPWLVGAPVVLAASLALASAARRHEHSAR